MRLVYEKAWQKVMYTYSGIVLKYSFEVLTWGTIVAYFNLCYFFTPLHFRRKYFQVKILREKYDKLIEMSNFQLDSLKKGPLVVFQMSLRCQQFQREISRRCIYTLLLK